MPRHVKTSRRDDNELEIFAAFRACGCLVYPGGPLDAVVGLRGQWWIVEIKDGSKPPSHRRLTPAEKAFIEQAHGYPVAIIETTRAVRDLVNRSDFAIYHASVLPWLSPR